MCGFRLDAGQSEGDKLTAVSERLRWPKCTSRAYVEGVDSADIELTGLAEEVYLIRSELGDLKFRIEAVERGRRGE
ncbi:MAG: hypothetical protein JO281_20800 [Pseudonocardiales bacterium]|nr:hypothetical protein [Pseudonocardiales bacterium]